MKLQEAVAAQLEQLLATSAILEAVAFEVLASLNRSPKNACVQAGIIAELGLGNIEGKARATHFLVAAHLCF